MLPELAEAFQIWRRETLYNQDNGWVFASPYTEGKKPYYGESAMSDHILPAVRESGCTKRVGWHTFRRSFACLMGDRDEDIKVVQELMRPSSSILTRDIYQQGAVAKKRLAITHSAESSALDLEDAGTENRRKTPLTWGAFLLSCVVTKTR